MWVNQYKDSPRHKTSLKELFFALRFAVLYVRNGFRTRSVLFYPEFPLYKTQLNRYLRGSRFNITNNPRVPFDLVVAWEDTTHRPRYALLEKLSRQCTVVNLDCTDISKRRVEEVSREVFGYGLFVDPTTHQGPSVRKCDANGNHDKTAVVKCPITDPDPTCVYQRLVDNRYDQKLVYDIRVQVCGDSIANAFMRYRSTDSRFTGDLYDTWHAVGELLSPLEIERVKRLARRMGLDYGEIDTVRDAADGSLYVVDVNNTPQAVASSVTFQRNLERQQRRQGREAFLRTFLRPTGRRRERPGRPTAASVPRRRRA